MFGVLQRLKFVAPVVVGVMLASGAQAGAEDLVMPYSCSVQGKALHVAPANETVYRIIGRRDEQPFVSCTKASSACETMMVHRFAIECDGTNVPWTRVTQAAAAQGISIPTGLPAGFAPVSSLSGRFVLPALVRTTSQISRVSMQDLSPDSVTEPIETASLLSDVPSGAQWVTEVRADVLRSVPGSNAGRVAASLAGVFLMLFAVSMVAAGRWRLPSLQAASLPLAAGVLAEGLARALDGARTIFFKAHAGLEQLWKGSEAVQPGDELANGILIVNARLLEVELTVAALGPHLLLHDVLRSEAEAIRTRIDEIERLSMRRGPKKTAALIRAVMRELDRMSRIAQSASQSTPDDFTSGERASLHDTPQSVPDAYRVLGINADVAPAVAKKLVDALRMSWHPDHARGEDDRVQREARMKQINAAWDIIKAQRAAA